jgi:DUF177 domain-containing protein
MLGGLTATVDPILLADNGERLSGRVPVQSMARLRAQLLDDAGEVEVDLLFERAEGSALRRMRGRIVADVQLNCQRCLEPMQFQLIAQPDTILLREGEPEPGLPPETDTLTVGTAPMTVAALIEEELLLALPMVPKHVLHECPARKYIRATTAKESQHPLAALGKPK